MRPVLFALTLIALLAAPRIAAAAEPVTANIEGHMLTLTFPANTLHHTVWLQLDNVDLPRSLSGGKRAAVHWESDTALSVDLHRVKRRIHLRWAHTAQVWGQTRNGDPLLQTVQLPDHHGAGGHAH